MLNAAQNIDAMQIILVNPPPASDWNCQPQNRDHAEYMYPYSLIFLLNYLLKKGIGAKLFDLYDTETSYLFEYCRGISSAIVGVTCLSDNRYCAEEIIRKIKKLIPGSIIVVGGKHFGYCAHDTLLHIKEVDIVVRGEGEITFYELVTALREKKKLNNIKGITFRENGQVIMNPEREPEPNIEEFALDYSLIPENNFLRGVLLRNYEKERIYSIPVVLTRGCDQKCVFCCYNKFKFRVRNLENVMKELRFLKEKHKILYFTFSDPSFCERRAFVKEFCNELIKGDFNIKWYCEARSDTPIELLEFMARAGCISLDFAFESGSQKVLDAMRKNIVVSQVVDFAKQCKRLGIRSMVFTMVSLPEETEKDALATLEVLKNLGKYVNRMAINVTEVLPGTQLEQIAQAKGILPKGFSWYEHRFDNPHKEISATDTPLFIEHLSVEFIKKFQRDFYIISAMTDSFLGILINAVKARRRISHQSFGKTMQDIQNFAAKFKNKLTNLP